MFCKLSKNSYVRIWGGKGYITNQVTRHDRLYNEIGADFLNEIPRIPTEESVIINNLQKLYGNQVERRVLEGDFDAFISDLQKFHFVVRGESFEECEKNDVSFSYMLPYAKTKINDFTQYTQQLVNENTYDAAIRADQREPRLKSMQFEITSRCNERCIHCYLPNSQKDCGVDMSYDFFCSTIDQFAALGGLHVSISGGEAFLHKDIIKMLQYCREKDLEICILSNLLALKETQIPLIKDVNVSYVQASLYSMVPEIHDHITTIQGSQQRTQKAIEMLIEADIPVQISCPIMKANKDSFSQVLNFAYSHHIKAFSDYIMMGQTDFCTDNLCNRLSIEETERVIRDIIEFDPNYSRWVNNIRGHIESVKNDNYANQALCGAGINSLCVSATGSLYPCPGWQSMIIGDLHVNTLQEVWQDSPQLKFIRNVKHSDFSQCMDCEAKKYCSQCLERNSNENNGDIFKIGKHFCDVAFLTKRLHEEYHKNGLL